MSSIEPIRPVSELRVEPSVRITPLDHRDRGEQQQKREERQPEPDEVELDDEDDDRPHVDVHA
jgi:hypothetical protein